MRIKLSSALQAWIDAVLVTALTSVALLLWYQSPIYPDEIAFRIAKMRLIPDDGTMRGLFAVCEPTGSTPAIWLIPVAWVLSWIDLHLTAYQLRALPIGTALFSVFSVILYACRFKKSPLSSAICLGFIGVAGSGLVITRFEHIAVLNVAICVFVLGIIASNKLSLTKAVVCIVLVLFITSASTFIHPQGLLFLPLSAFVIFRVIFQLASKGDLESTAAKLIGLGCVAVLILFVVSAISGLNYCKGSEAMLNEFSKLTMQSIPTTLEGMFNFLSAKIANYTDSFLYKSEYQVNYLPGVVDANNHDRLFAVNLILRVYIVGLVMAICLATAITTIQIIRIIVKSGNRSRWLTMQSSVAAALIGFPGILLIIYDHQQYFYRSIFINFIFSISLVLFLIDALNLKTLGKKYLILGGFAFPLMLSLFFNYKLFYYRLPDWDAIYSMPGKTIASSTLLDVSILAEQCGINPASGGLVVDGSTYDALKRNSNLQLIWYVEYQSTVSKLPISKIVELSDSHNVIASCNAIERSGVGLPYQQRRGQLCCFSYPRGEISK